MRVEWTAGRRRWATRCCFYSALALGGAALVPGTCAETTSASSPISAWARRSISLDGPWQFQRDGARPDRWKSVGVPSSFQSHEGTQFHGVGWYRKTIAPFTVPAGHRVLVHFQAAATEADVWWDGEKVGHHLGGWTPFRVDVTDGVRRGAAGTPHELRVRLDEKVGHNTQGFLPIIAPHFGGLWQEVQLFIVPENYVDDLRLRSIGNPQTRRIELEFPVIGGSTSSVPGITVRYRLRGTTAWEEYSATATAAPRIDAAGRNGERIFQVEVPIPGAKFWSPEEPNLYELAVRLPAAAGGDSIRTRAAFRRIEAQGRELQLNGRPLSVRGLLNWGYSPPRVAPNPGEGRFRRELELARSYGFNLMKFCLWVPPPRYLELADEMGVLTWMEYPTWHPTMTRQFLEPLEREFGEFFAGDRNHPSVILRSLTCETGAGAEPDVLRALSDQAHAMVPGALVEDDSSWIEWNRITDFWDDHPYGNNHTWVATLHSLNHYIQAHGPKPLLLGEAIAADTWVDRPAVLQRLGRERPFWAPAILDDQPRWMERMRALAGPGGLNDLGPDSLRYAWLMRKYQVEAYRREAPAGGYVISVIRDTATASMGLVDYLDRPKWPAPDWAWQGDTMLLLQTDADRRSFFGGESLKASVLVSHFGPQPLANARLVVTVARTNPAGEEETLRRVERMDLQEAGGTLARAADLDFTLPSVSRPTRITVRAVLRSTQGERENAWPLWVVPSPPPGLPGTVWRHSSLAPDLVDELFPGVPAWPTNGVDGVVIASRFDDALVRWLDRGGRVLLLPDGQKHSFPLKPHWFLQGGPWVPDSPLLRAAPRDFFVELQAFDLASAVIANPPYLASIDPLLMLWDSHESRTITTHGLIFETQVGGGRLLVSTVRHRGDANAAGRWLLRELLRQLTEGPPPRHAFPPRLWRKLKDTLHEEKVALVDRVWRFKPDPAGEGLRQGWQSPALVLDGSWKDIHIGSAWESQGYPSLDGWAWYRLVVNIPAHWQGREVYLSFEGVDDIYELYINGRFAGKSGDLAKHINAFNERKSYRLTPLIQPGRDCLIAVRVYDWYGAGGIFRPVTLATRPIDPGAPLLK